MFLFLLRHAEAVDRGVGMRDADRALTDKGKEQSLRVGRFCVREGLIPDLVLTSPYLRARATADLVAGELDLDVQVEPFLAAGMSPETGVAELKSWCRFASVMLVGHEPDFSQMVAYLLGISSADAVRLRKASLTGIESEGLTPGRAVLQFSLPVRLMR